MHFNFIEIGTSSFNTLLEKATKEKGLSIEPVSDHLNRLPDRQNVVKINAGITHNKQTDKIKVFYLPIETIQSKGLPQWFRGCNTIGKYHPLHIKHGVQKYVITEEVALIDFSELIIDNSVKKVDYIKIDTEGHDCIIMKGIYDFYLKNEDYNKPLKIQFETNEWSSKSDVDKIIDLFEQIGYRLKSRGYDTVLELVTSEPTFKSWILRKPC